MAEKYTKLHELQDNLVCSGSPVMVEKGFLIRDNETGSVFAQVKLLNLQDKPVASLDAELHYTNAQGEGGIVCYTLGADEAKNNESFGFRDMISMPEDAVFLRGFECNTVRFADGSVWEDYNYALWTPVSVPVKEDVPAYSGTVYAPAPVTAEKKKGSKKGLLIGIIAGVTALLLVVVLLLTGKAPKYNRGRKALENGDFDLAIAIFNELGDYRDSSDLIKIATYDKADELYYYNNFDIAADLFESLGNYKDSEDRFISCLGDLMWQYYYTGEYLEAVETADRILEIDPYDSWTIECRDDFVYSYCWECYEKEDYLEGMDKFLTRSHIEYSDYLLKNLCYGCGDEAMGYGSYETAIFYYDAAMDVQDAKTKALDAMKKYMDSVTFDPTNEDHLEYLIRLTDAGYSEYDDLAAQTFKWRAKLIFNDEMDDFDLNYEYISNYMLTCCHVTLEGDKHSSVLVEYVIEYPDGTGDNGAWENKLTVDDVGTLWFGENTLTDGMLYVYIYVDGTLAGFGQVYIVA